MDRIEKILIHNFPKTNEYLFEEEFLSNKEGKTDFFDTPLFYLKKLHHLEFIVKIF